MNRYNVLRKKYTFDLTHFVRLLGFITEGIFTDTVNKSSSITFYQNSTSDSMQMFSQIRFQQQSSIQTDRQFRFNSNNSIDSQYILTLEVINLWFAYLQVQSLHQQVIFTMVQSYKPQTLASVPYNASLLFYCTTYLLLYLFQNIFECPLKYYYNNTKLSFGRCIESNHSL